MARVTVEDCVEKIPNRFQLVMIAAQRARKLGSGAGLTIERDDDKNPVVALREIAGQTLDNEDLKEELTRSHQRIVAYDDQDDSIDLMDGEEEWGTIAGQQAQNEGMYADGDIVDDNDGSDDGDAFDPAPQAQEAEPSLEDLAGAKVE